MADKIDIEKLIDLVRHNPCLYDPKNPQYKDAIQTRNIWNSIGKALKITGEQAKKKWWSKKDHFMKLKNTKTKSGQGTEEKLQRWKWYPFMESLIPYMQEVSTQSNLSSDDDLDSFSDAASMDRTSHVRSQGSVTVTDAGETIPYGITTPTTRPKTFGWKKKKSIRTCPSDRPRGPSSIRSSRSREKEK